MLCVSNNLSNQSQVIIGIPQYLITAHHYTVKCINTQYSIARKISMVSGMAVGFHAAKVNSVKYI